MPREDTEHERLIVSRKSDHVEICANEDMRRDYAYWDDVKLVHRSLPEIDLDDIDTSVVLLGQKLEAPIIISAMTGGYGKAEEINRNLASVAAEHGVGMGVGSQRAAIEEPDMARTYGVIKEFDVPLRIANLGAPQLIRQGLTPPLEIDSGRTAMEMIDAHVLAIHLNYLQEVVQPEGDTKAKGVLKAVERFATALPVIAKETGAGVSRESALQLKKARVRGIDVGGLGGTSFSGVEYYRARAAGDSVRANIGETFWDWGLPTPVSVVLASVGLPVIATGGVRTGLDVARAVAVGASAAGMAGRLLPAALQDREALSKELGTIVDELKAAMFLVGASSVKELADTKALIEGRSRSWLDHLME